MENFKKESEKFTIEENREYYIKTTNKIKDLEELIHSLEENVKVNKTMSDSYKQKRLNDITEKIKSERTDFYNLIDFLANYDKTLYAKMYEELLEKVAKLKQIIFPKKKFAFSSKISRKTNPTTQDSPSNPKSKEIQFTGELNQQNDEYDLIIKDMSGQVVKYIYNDPYLINKNNVMIENISNSEIYILSHVKCCFVKNITNSKIVFGSVSGGSHFTDCENCEIYLATHQLRIHKTTNSKFYVMINSKPIIEHSTRNIFYPLKINYDGYYDNLVKANIDINDNKYNQVQDFQWLKQGRSPNFEIMDDNLLFSIN